MPLSHVSHMVGRFKHGGDLALASARYGKPESDFLDFSVSCNPLGSPPGLSDFLSKELDKILRYPDHSALALREALSQAYGGTPENYLVTNGANEALYLICALFASSKVRIICPTYVEYERACLAYGCRVDHFAVRPEDDFEIDVDELAALEALDVLILCNPNNPNGKMLTADVMQEMLQKVSKKYHAIVVDESFVELSDFPSDSAIPDLVRRFPNLIVVRSMTKTFGIAGLRLGFVFARRDLISSLASRQPTWSVNSLAQAAGGFVLRNRGSFLEESRKLIASQREVLRKGLCSLGFKVFSSNANFLLFKVGWADPGFFEEALGQSGILVRNCSNFRGLEGGFFRIGVRSSADNQRFIAASAKIERSIR